MQVTDKYSKKHTKLSTSSYYSLKGGIELLLLRLTLLSLGLELF